MCITNDGALRKSCKKEGVEVRWGLELMVELVGLGKLDGAEAESVAREIQAVNPTHISDVLIAKFIGELRKHLPPGR